jgi:hypothetical protein
MAGYGYSYVTDKGFTSFARELSEGAWGGISIEIYDSEAVPPVAREPLANTPVAVLWKLRAIWAIRGLVRALGIASAEELMRLDAEWDSSQRALNLALLTEAEHKEAERRAAAERLRASLLSGAGTSQTRLSYDKEVDFGYAQMTLVGKAPLAADAEVADLAPYLERIRDATLALATGLGREPGQTSTGSRARRIQKALPGCSTAFNAMHDELDWLIEHTIGEDSARFEALRVPLVALIDRYPPRPKTSSEEVEEQIATDEDEPEAGTPD